MAPEKKETAESAPSATPNTNKEPRPENPIPLPPLETSPTVKAKENRSSLGKEIREWASVGISLVALGVSAASYSNSSNTSKLEQRRFDASRALVLVAELDKAYGVLGMNFKLRPLQSTQHISVISITAPSELSKYPWTADAPEQNLSLQSIYMPLQDFFRNDKDFPSSEDVSVYVQIPVILDTLYSVDSDVMKIRGLYTISATAYVYKLSSNSITIRFHDFIPQGGGDLNQDAQKIVDQAWEGVKRDLPHNTQRVIVFRPGMKDLPPKP